MNLYLVRGNDVDGENSDYFALAENPCSAIVLWNNYMVSNGFPREEGDEEDEGNIPPAKYIDPSNVREIIPNLAGDPYGVTERIIEWHEFREVA